MTNREITFIVKLRNDARQALRELAGDLASTAQSGNSAGTGVASAATGMSQVRDAAGEASRAVRQMAGDTGGATTAANGLGETTRRAAQQAQQSAQTMTQYQREMRSANDATALAYAEAADQQAEEDKRTLDGKKELMSAERQLMALVKQSTAELAKQAQAASKAVTNIPIASASTVKAADPATSRIGKWIDGDGNIMAEQPSASSKPQFEAQLRNGTATNTEGKPYGGTGTLATVATGGADASALIAAENAIWNATTQAELEAAKKAYTELGGVLSGPLLKGMQSAGAGAKTVESTVEKMGAAAQSRFGQFKQWAIDTFDGARDRMTFYADSAGGLWSKIFGTNVKAAASAAAAGLKEAEKATESFTSKLTFGSGAIREMIVLMREAARGDFSRMAGSASLLAQNLGVIEAAGIGVIATVAALAVATGVLLTAVARGSVEQTRFNNTISLTGNYAGLTADRFDDMAKRISDATNTSIGSNKDLLSQLQGQNNLTGDEMEKVVTMSQRISRATGESAGDVMKNFEKMTDAPTKFAETMVQTYTGIISPVQVEHIRLLEAQGDKAGAVRYLIEVANKGIADSTTQNAGFIVDAWHSATKAVSGYWDALKNLGKTQSLNEQIDGLTARINENKKASKENANSWGAWLTGTDGGASIIDKGTAALVKQRDGLIKQKAALDATADAKAKATAGDKLQAEAADRAATSYTQGVDSQNNYRNAIVALNNTLADGVKMARGTPLPTLLAAAAKSALPSIKELGATYQQQVERIKKTTLPVTTRADNKADRAAAAQRRKEEREAASEAKKAAEERKQTIKSSASEMDSLAKSYDPYLDRLAKNEQALDQIAKLQTLQKTDNAAFKQSLDQSGLSLEQFNTIVEQVQNNVKTDDVDKLFSKYIEGYKGLSAEAGRVEEQGLLTRLFDLAKDKGEAWLKTISNGKYTLERLNQAAAGFKLNIDPKQAKSAFGEYIRDYDLFAEHSKDAEISNQSLFDSLDKARATGGAEWIKWLKDHNVTAEQAAKAEKDFNDKITVSDIDKRVSAIQSLAESMGVLSKEDAEHYALQRQVATLENLRTSNAGAFKVALDALGMSQEDYAKVLERSNKKIGDTKSFMGGAKAAAVDYLGYLKTSGETMTDVWSDAFKNMESALVSFVTTGKLDFSNLINSFIADLAKLEIEKQIMPKITALFGVGHSGGLAGSSGGDGGRAVSPAVFAGAKRYHVGGLAGAGTGLRSGEVPVVAKQNEALLPTARMPDGNFGIKAIIPDDLKNGRGSGNTMVLQPNIAISINGDNHDPETLGQTVSSHTVKALEGMVKRVMTDEMRDGGLLSKR